MVDFKGGSVALVGYGASNRALCRYLMENGVYPVVRNQKECDLPKGIRGIFGGRYLDTAEDIIFRSPGIHPRLIYGRGKIYTEVGFALDIARGYKIGVTGSDGKTTTSTLIYRMLSVGNKNAYLGGNIGRAIVGFADKTSESDYLVAELSSFQLYDFSSRLDVAAVTNITENHLDWHKDMEEYILAKKNIVRCAKKTVLNYDDPVVRGFGAQGTVYFSLKDCTAELCKNDFVHVVDGWVCYNTDRLFSVSDICLKGEFNVQNVLCAVGCTYDIVGKEPCIRVAKEFCGVDNRMEMVDAINGVTFINSAIDTTPSRTVKTLSAFPLDRVAVILGGYDKNLSYDLLKDVLKGAKAVILCGENREKISAVTKRRVINVNTLKEAVGVSLELVSSGDYVILSPASASFDMFENYKQKAECFKTAVKEMQNHTRQCLEMQNAKGKMQN